MKVSAKQIQALDRLAIDGIGIPSIVLMENAGRAVASEVVKKLKPKKRRVCIFCGQGNNAGDGFVVGRYLIGLGLRPDIFLIGNIEELKPDALINYQILKNLGLPVTVIKDQDDFKVELKAADVVVDAIFGVGLNRPIEGVFKMTINAINHSAKYIFSVDVPSGLDPTTGSIYGVCIKANETVTFSLAKAGMFVKNGPNVCGKIKVVDIGIPKNLIKRIINDSQFN